MPTARVALHAAIVDGCVYLLGGTSPTVEGATLERFDLSSWEWSQLPEIPTPRNFAGVAALGSKIYVAGGLGSESLFEVYDTQGAQWATLPDLPSPRNRLRALACHGRIYVVGGMQVVDGALTDVATVESYDPATRSWRAEPPLPTARHGHAAVVFQEKIYVIGGSAGEGVVEIYDPQQRKWHSGRSLGRRLLFHEAAVVAEGIWVFGNRDYPPIPLQRYVPALDVWERVESHSVSRHRMASCVVGDQVLMFGGENNVGMPHVLGSVVIYSVLTGAWLGERGEDSGS